MNAASTARAAAPPPSNGRARALCAVAAVAAGAGSFVYLQKMKREPISPYGLGMHPKAEFANNADRALGVPMQPIAFPHATEDVGASSILHRQR